MTSVRVPNFKILLDNDSIEEIIGMVRSTLKSSAWVQGPMTQDLERAFAEYSGSLYARALSSGGAALLLILRALELSEDSIVLCPTLTAPPTPHAVLSTPARVVFVDSNPSDLSLDTADLVAKLDEYRNNVSAVILVHIAGWISHRLDEMSDICKSYGVRLIEDCAHAHGSMLNNRRAGSAGIAAAYSFFMTKPLTSGEGGIVTTNSLGIAEAIRELRNYGKNDRGIHVRPGFNYRLSEFNAAVACWATRNASSLIEQRRALAKRYDNLLANLEYLSIVRVEQCQPSYYKYIVRLPLTINRDRVRQKLLDDYGIEAAGGVYDRLCHEEPYFRNVANVLNSHNTFGGAEAFSRSHLCLPLYPGLSEQSQELVAHAMKEVLASPDVRR